MGSIREALSVEWERESYPAYADFALLPFFALFFPSVRFFLDRFVFEVRHAAALCRDLVSWPVLLALLRTESSLPFVF